MNFMRLCVALACISSASAWISANRPGRQTVQGRCTTTQLKAVETISLKELTNPEDDGTKMAESLTQWLDQEVTFVHQDDVRLRSQTTANARLTLSLQNYKVDATTSPHRHG
jgi:hypothetical protein